LLRFDEQSDADQALVEKVRKQKQVAQPNHDRWREQAEKRYALYRSFRSFKKDWRDVGPNDRDDFWQNARRTFGTELFIPHCFATVETTVPKMLSQLVRPQVKPLEQDAEANTLPMQQTIDAQMAQIHYNLTLQDVGKTGLIYGLGIQKVRWRYSTRSRPYLAPVTVLGAAGPSHFKKVEQDYVDFDDPEAIWVDPFDWFYDDNGWDMQTIEFCIHRTWRTRQYIKERVQAKDWRNIEESDLESLEPTGSGEWDRVMEGRLEARGFADVNRTRDRDLHEVWEYHDRNEVITVLDNNIVVASGPNPYWHGKLPFQIYRPTKVPGELPGIGEIEPIEDLQREINEMRTQRRDNAVLVLNKPFAYWDGLVDPDEIRFGAGTLIPTPGDPRELIRPLDVGDIPGSGYQEEAALVSDIEKTSGISETVAGGNSNAASVATATGAQLVQQAASLRVQNKLRLLEEELMVPTVEQFGELNQQKIRTPRDIRLPGMPELEPAEGSVLPTQRWQWITVGPDSLQGKFEYTVDSGASQPDNIPQMRQDAQMKYQMLGQNPMIEQRKMLAEVMHDLGFKDPERFLAPPGPNFPAIDPNVVGQLLVQAGVDQNVVQQALQQGQAAAMQAGATNQEGSPGAEQQRAGAAPDQQEGAPALNGQP
jgi:hypothetical protein